MIKRFASSNHEAPAVAGVSFEARAKAITTLLGPSGSGKSTLLRLIAGLEVPDEGRVFLDGEDVTFRSPRERNVGFVFQSYALFKHLCVADNIAFGMKIRGLPSVQVRKRVAELLSLVQLPGYGARFPAQLSGGQRQRVALARALAIEPKVLLLDEPFGALDTQVRLELREWLLALHERTGITTILVTHDQEEALELSSHVVLLEQGKIAQAGSPHELYDHPANEFVASFLGGANVIQRRVAHGAAQFGRNLLPAPNGASDGTPVHAFVRPHNIRVRKPNGDAAVDLGKIERLTRVGGFVKVYVSLPTGESITVQMPKSELDTLAVEPGDVVALDVLDAKVFAQRYSI
ncbi:MAG TPA: sulfate/molybdate ABC transporter ATP-binding protein [Polyangiaceae bacterium]|jgi:sulfate transport system ATP-binding protein|nr:sulfate/molybdate ABC transporter ATP-binding protein [Polyangiaceae bacterium]